MVSRVVPQRLQCTALSKTTNLRCIVTRGVQMQRRTTFFSHNVSPPLIDMIIALGAASPLPSVARQPTREATHTSIIPITAIATVAIHCTGT